MVYCGRILRDQDALKLSGLVTGCTVHALKKKAPLQKLQAGKNLILAQGVSDRLVDRVLRSVVNR